VKGEVHIEFRWEYPKGRENLEDLGIDARKYKQLFKK
jgi:hypothetical protein